MCDKIHGKHGLIVMHMLFLEWDESEPLEFNARSFDLPCWLTKNSASTKPPPPKAMINFSENCGMKPSILPCTVMAIRVVEFSNGGYKIRKIFA